MRNYKGLKIWQNGMLLCKEIYDLVSILPNEEKYGLRSQITRSAVSIPSNIAEGSSRSSDKEFARFLEIALGSCFELETQLLLIAHTGWIDHAKSNFLSQSVTEEQKMLSGMIRKLKA